MTSCQLESNKFHIWQVYWHIPYAGDPVSWFSLYFTDVKIKLEQFWRRLYRVEIKFFFKEYVCGHHRWILRLRSDGNNRPKNWFWPWISKFSFALYPSHREGETFPRNHRSQSDSSFEKWQEILNFLYHLTLRRNSDFMVLDA